MGLEFEKLELERKDISGSTFTEVNAEGLSFANVNLSKTKIDNANLSEGTFNDINAGGLKLSNANLSNASIRHANMSGMKIDHVHLFGTEFSGIVLPQEGDGNYEPNGQYPPIVFDGCDLRHMEIRNCNIAGLKIDGILIEDLLKSK
ncbi:pentapeptide repeat-containing protein [Saccharibacillus sp. VR-M41]|uniref:Pentapeptide repeat-containing protein n=2 Tax=Saccharibacillus alkalitolerans TaxID=2705290 RepID=A0ABX0FBK6_9BACL|nr:pentapeptide repeat-containing protein [Saccharibacillus alkalitolerans]